MHRPEDDQASPRVVTPALAGALVALDTDPRCIQASAWPGNLTGLDRPGLYAWWVDAAGAADLSAGLQIELLPGRIYVGQAGAASSRAGIASASTLRSRIGCQRRSKPEQFPPVQF